MTRRARVNTLTFDNNHAAAYRAMTLVNYYCQAPAGRGATPDLRAALEASLAGSAPSSRYPRTSRATYNHGFNEGAALLLIADNFPAMPGASGWRTTALARLQGMLDANLDSDGVEVENSPFYHVYVLGLVYQIAQWASLYEPALAPSYTQAAQRMLRYAAYVTQPSGYLPMLGATATTYMPSQDPTVYGPMANSRPRVRLRLHARRTRHAAAGRDVPVPLIGPLRHALAARRAVEPRPADVRHLRCGALPHRALRPRRARDHDVLERIDGAARVRAVHLHGPARPLLLPWHARPQHRRRRRRRPGRGRGDAR